MTPWILPTEKCRHLKEAIKNQITKLTNRLQGFKFDSMSEEYAQNSMKLFRAELAKRYKSNGTRKVFSKQSFLKDFSQFINENIQ